MKSTIFCLCALLLGTASLRAQEKWDLRKCVDYALENNISVKQQDVQARLAALTWKQSRLSQIPDLNFNSSASLNTGRSIDPTTNQFTTQSIFYNRFSLQSNVDVFNFGFKRNTIAANRLNAEAATAAVDKLKDDIALNVAGAYLQVLLNREQVNISNVQVQQTAAQLSNTRKLVQAGSLPELNAAQLEAQLAQDSANLISAQGNEMQSLLLLKALLNLDAAAPFDILTPPVDLIPVEPLADLLPEKVYQLALANLPQQRVNELKLQSARKSADAAHGAMYPTIGAGGSLGTSYSNAKNNRKFLGQNGFEDIGFVKGSLDTVVVPNFVYDFFASPYGTQINQNFSKGIGVNLVVPIFNGGSARTNWERSKLNVRTYELQQQQDNMNLKQDIYKAYTDAITSMETWRAAQKAVQTSQVALDFSNKRYNVGLLNTIDLITAQSNLFRARIQMTLAHFNYVFKMKVLEFYKGQGLKL